MASSDTLFEEQECKLLNLPAELRTQVYQYALLEKELIEIKYNYFRCNVRELSRTSKWQPPGLLQTCRQLRNEARAIYYARNHFVIPRDGRWAFSLFDWLTALDPLDVASIRHIRIASTNSHCPDASIAILKHFWKTWIEESALGLSKDSLYWAVSIRSDHFDESELPDLVCFGWLNLNCLENANIRRDSVFVEDLEGFVAD